MKLMCIKDVTYEKLKDITLVEYTFSGNSFTNGKSYEYFIEGADIAGVFIYLYRILDNNNKTLYLVMSEATQPLHYGYPTWKNFNEYFIPLEDHRDNQINNIIEKIK